MKLLCISRDENMAQQIEEEASTRQWSAVCISDRSNVQQSIRDYNPDMVWFDEASMADLDWMTASGVLGERPAFLINHDINEEFAIKAFELGVDGLIPKSHFSRRYFAARVNAFIRRRDHGGVRRSVSRLSLIVDSQKLKAEVRGSALTLTPTEFKILRELAREDLTPITRSQLQDQAFGATKVSRRSLDVHICALRKKLRPVGLTISSSRGVGYVMSSCPA